MRVSLRLGIAAGLLFLGAAAWVATQPAPTETIRVSARLGGPGGLPLDRPLPIKKIGLGRQTRSAIITPAGTSFQLDLQAGATRLMIALGVSGATGPPTTVRFTIKASMSGDWKTVLSERIGSDAARWDDHVVDLATAAPGARALLFKTETVDDRGVAPTAYWGSVRVLGRPPLARAEWLLRGLPTRGRHRPTMNVILISLDTLSARDLGHFGGPAGVSPHLDAFLDDAFSFRRAYAQYPGTLQSHASMLTGLYPIHHRVGLHGAKPRLRDHTMAEVLGGAGYLTAAVTEDAFVGAAFGFDQGFDRYDDGLMEEAEDTFAAAIDWLEHFGGDAPFFLFVHTYKVHTPYHPRRRGALRLLERTTRGYDGPFKRSFRGGQALWDHNWGRELLPEADIDQVHALYLAEIHGLDEIVGNFLRRISYLPAADRTLIVLTADHGDAFNGHGQLGHGTTLYNRVLHVPLAFFAPGRIAPGRSDAPVELVDVMPTILDIVGAQGPATVHGQSLWPLIQGRGGVDTGPVYSELDEVPFWSAAWRRRGRPCVELGLSETCRRFGRAVQTRRFKLIRSETPRFEHLYDLEADPLETTDVSARFPDRVARLGALLDEYEELKPLAPADDPSTLHVDTTTERRLRMLGYIE
jgi:arylsulfatase A-like enzyme